MSLLDQFWGKRKFQRIFERLLSASLKGMNYGRASDYRHNGEHHAIELVKQSTRSAVPVLFDVGANKGEFTRHIMQTWQGVNYKLYAFEPSRKTFEMLKSSVQSANNVQLVNRGLGSQAGVVDLYYDREGSGLASVYPRDLTHRSIDFAAKESIELTTLDAFCDDHRISSIDFLKLDVEGHEFAVLQGGAGMFERGNVKMVQFEFGGCNIDSRTFFRDYFNFFKKDFLLHRILSDGLAPLERYSEKLEIFQSANYLAIRKD